MVNLCFIYGTICVCVLCFSHAIEIFTYLTGVTKVCFKLCHLKDKDIKKFTVLTNKGGNKLKNRKERGES
jgi:hypothetical protein